MHTAPDTYHVDAFCTVKDVDSQRYAFSRVYDILCSLREKRGIILQSGQEQEMESLSAENDAFQQDMIETSPVGDDKAGEATFGGESPDSQPTISVVGQPYDMPKMDTPAVVHQNGKRSWKHYKFGHSADMNQYSDMA